MASTFFHSSQLLLNSHDDEGSQAFFSSFFDSPLIRLFFCHTKENFVFKSHEKLFFPSSLSQTTADACVAVAVCIVVNTSFADTKLLTVENEGNT